MLYHFSEQGDIACFEPRVIEGLASPVVWAIDAARQCNYLLPRDCPRVTYYADQATSAADAERLLNGARAIVAIEAAWLQRVQTARIFRYRLREERFQCIDETAGYYVSTQPVVSTGMETLDNLPQHIAAVGATLQILPTLWPVHDIVAASTLRFSMIRMRNAQPRTTHSC